MIDQNTINNIVRFLNLEKIDVDSQITLYCFPKKIDNEFKEKLEKIMKDVKKLGNNSVIFKIVEEGEIDNVKTIEFSE